MNKKIFGIRLGTVLTMITCIAVALVVWMIAKYEISDTESNSGDTAYFCVTNLCRGKNEL